MASIKILIRDSKVKKDGTYPIEFRVTENGKHQFKITGHSVKKNQFKDGVVIRHPDARLINADIEQKRSALFEEVLTARPEEKSILTLIKEKLTYYEQMNQAGAYFKLNAIKKAIVEAWGGDKKVITKALVDQYVVSRKVAKSTLKKDLSVLFRITGNKLFSEAQTRIKADPVNIGKLTLEEIKALEDVQLTGKNEVIRDMFLFSYYCHGMRLENVLTFKKEFVKGNVIRYQMNKGKAWREIEIHPKLKALIKKYNSTPYLFPMLTEEIGDVWSKNNKIGSQNALINTRLKLIAIEAGIEQKLHFHMARHTFAFHTLERDVSVQTIQNALGHGSIKTTEKYLKGLSDKKINSEVNGLYK